MDVFQMKSQSVKQAFLDDLRPKYIMPSLLKYKVITTSDEKDILSELKPKDQVEKLFSILTKKSPHLFPHVIKALNVDLDGDKTYPWLAVKLEQTTNLSNKANSALVNGNIPFPINHLVHRPEKLLKIRETLIEVAETKSRHWVVLVGPIGSGKTVLAAESLRNNALAEKYFAGGIYWINVGDSKEEEALWLKMKRLLKMMNFTDELHPSETTYDLTLMLKKEVCGKPKMLLVLDDVWHDNAIKAFDIGCPILVTTKNKKALNKVSSYCTDMECKDDFEPDEILELLAKYVNCESKELPQVAKDVCLKCKGSPLVTSLIGGKMANVGKSESAWEALNYGMGSVRKRIYSEDFNKDLYNIVNMCLEPVQEYKDFYLDFLIFIKDIPVPNKVLEILWDKEDFDVQHIMFELSNRCFVQWERSEEDDNSYSYTSHDLYLETLEADFEDLVGEKKKRHKKLVDKVLQRIIKEDGKIDMTHLPKEYLPFTIGYHLFYAGEHKMLRKLYLDLPFIEQKIHLTGVVRDILSDYDHYRCCFYDEDEVETFKSFIQRNYVALTQKKSDIIQLALFEPENSNVYKIACEAASRLSAEKIYYKWCNKDESTLHLFHDFKSPYFKSMSHAVINEDASRIAVVDEHIAMVHNSDGAVLQELHGHSNVINYCSLNSVGDRLITASEDTTVKIFKIVESLTSSGNFSGKRLSATTVNVNAEMKDDSLITFNEHENPVICCAFSPDDQFIISCDMEHTYVWQVSGIGWIDKYRKQPPNPKCPFNFCCFNNNGTMFAASAYNTIQVWDFDTGEKLATLFRCLEPFNVKSNINRFCFSPNDSHLLSISDNVVTEWDINSGQKTYDISTGPRKDYVLCSLCLNEKYIACGTTKGSVIIISRDTKTVVNNLRGHNRDVISVMLSKNGKMLFSASSKAYILHNTSHWTDSPLVSFEGNMSAAHIYEDLVVASSNYFNCVEVRRGLEGTVVSSSLPEENKITACSLSNDCSQVVYGTRSGNVKVFTIATTKDSSELAPKHTGQVNYILHSKNNLDFFTCSEDKTVHIWRDGINALILKGHKQSVLMCVQFLKSKKLVSCSCDGSLRVWNSESGELILPITEGHGNQDVRFCDISREEVLLASASTDETIKIWSALNGELKKTFSIPKDRNSAVRCCRFSPFSQILISGHDNGKLVLWHLLGNQPFRILTTHDSVVYDIRFSKFGPAQFLSLSSSIKLWNNAAQLLQTVLLPTSYMGVDPPCMWATNNFQVMVVIQNSILYILKGFEPTV